jgi:hypothetical protein
MSIEYFEDLKKKISKIMKKSSFSFKKIVLWEKVIFLKIFSISESNMICAEVKSPKVLQYIALLHGLPWT